MSSTPIRMLLYHAVCEAPDPRFAEWAVTPELFGAHMDHLAEQGYETLTVSELADRAFAGRPPGPRTIAITFDDALEDVHTHALGHLLRHGMTATVYVTTSCIGGTSTWLQRLGHGDHPVMSAEQLADAAAHGIELGAHGHTHRQLDTLSPGALREEVRRSRDIMRRFGPARSFAYPHGYNTRRARRAVAEAGFDSACAVEDAIGTSSDDRLALARLVVRWGTSVGALSDLLQTPPRPASERRRPVRRAAWRAVRRAGGEPLAERLLAARPRSA